MNKYYSETNFDNLIKSIEFNICVLLKCFVEFLSKIHCLSNEQTLLFITNMFGNQKRSIISAHVLTIVISIINTYVKGHKWIDTMKKHFHGHNYEVYYIDLR